MGGIQVIPPQIDTGIPGLLLPGGVRVFPPQIDTGVDHTAYGGGE